MVCGGTCPSYALMVGSSLKMTCSSCRPNYGTVRLEIICENESKEVRVKIVKVVTSCTCKEHDKCTPYKDN